MLAIRRGGGEEGLQGWGEGVGCNGEGSEEERCAAWWWEGEGDPRATGIPEYRRLPAQADARQAGNERDKGR